MPSQSEAAYAFYASGSGLPASASLAEHQFAYLKSHGAAGATSLVDAQKAVWGSQGEYAWLKSQVSGSGSLDTLRALYYAGGGIAPTNATYDTSIFDSTAVFA